MKKFLEKVVALQVVINKLVLQETIKITSIIFSFRLK